MSLYLNCFVLSLKAYKLVHEQFFLLGLVNKPKTGLKLDLFINK